MTPDHQPQCGTCKDIEKIETVKYRCKWNLCFIKPQDTCPCKPSHYSEAPHTSPRAPAALKFSSEDLILLANDEWKRREERKHRHEETTWVAGFINGFLTDKKWARGCVDKIRAGVKK